MEVLWAGEFGAPDPEEHWLAGPMECLICRATCISVRPATAAIPCECPKCGRMAMVSEVQAITSVARLPPNRLN